MKNEIYQKALLHIDEYRCAKFACSAFIICKKRTATHPLFAKSIYFLSLEIPRQDLLTRKNLLIILQVSLQQLRRIQTIRALAHAVAAVEAVLDLIIFGCTSGVSWRWDGDLLRSRDILAQVLISIPAGHGIQ